MCTGAVDGGEHYGCSEVAPSNRELWEKQNEIIEYVNQTDKFVAELGMDYYKQQLENRPNPIINQDQE